MTATVPPSPLETQGHRQVEPAERSFPATLSSRTRVGAVAFLGEGAPDPDAGPPHAPQVLRRPDAVILLVSPTLAVARVGEAIGDAAREANAEPKARTRPQSPAPRA